MSLSILLLYKNTQGVNSHGLVGELLKTSRWNMIDTDTKGASGNNILAKRYTGLVFALDMNDFKKYIIYGFFKNYTNEGAYGNNAKTVVIASNELSLGASNNVGTQVINGGTNVQQFMIGLGG